MASKKPNIIASEEGEAIVLSAEQQVTAIITGGILGGMIARLKPYEKLTVGEVQNALSQSKALIDNILKVKN